MSPAILLITHEKLGACMSQIACKLMNCDKSKPHLIEVPDKCNPDDILEQARLLVNKLDQGGGLVILTDIYGSTPSNIAHKLINDNVRVITGLNLPMLIRVMNYSENSLDEIIEKAVSGGRDGIVLSGKQS
jgi:PTS system ascorbate-specific IIA component